MSNHPTTTAQCAAMAASPLGLWGSLSCTPVSESKSNSALLWVPPVASWLDVLSASEISSGTVSLRRHRRGHLKEEWWTQHGDGPSDWTITSSAAWARWQKWIPRVSRTRQFQLSFSAFKHSDILRHTHRTDTIKILVSVLVSMSCCWC